MPNPSGAAPPLAGATMPKVSSACASGETNIQANSEVLKSDVLKSDVLKSGVLKSIVFNSKVLNTEVLNTEVLNTEVLIRNAPNRCIDLLLTG
jgi:hypothetical protein